MKRLVRLTVGSMALLVLAGCVMIGDRLDQARWHFGSIPFFVFDNAKGYVEPKQPVVMDEPVNFAIAISGGGSRSAVFAAGVMEQLAAMRDPRHGGRTLLDGCDVISGVSGGSMAAAYYAMFKPDSFSDEAKAREFFANFKSHMTVDFWMRGWVHYMSHPWEGAMRYYTRYRTVQSLANTFDQYLFKGACFTHIHEREKAGTCPAIIINAASLDTGRRFLFTNLNVGRAFAVDAHKLGAMIPSIVPDEDAPAMLLMAQFLSSPVTSPFGFDSIDSDIDGFRVASAVAASSAYPVLPGPAALMDYRTNGYVHLADGGVNDNFGMDSVVQLYLARMQKSGKARKLVILCLDAAGRLEPKKAGDPNGYTGALAYGERANTISGMRGHTLSGVLYGGQGMVQVVRLSLRDSVASKVFDSGLANYYISEHDMYRVLQAAQEEMNTHAPTLEAALSGQRIPAQ